MKKSIEKVKGFSFGIGIAGITALAAGTSANAQRLCSGSCGQCFSCGIAALPLVLWLMSKYWWSVLVIRLKCGDKTDKRCRPENFAVVHSISKEDF